MSFLFGRFGTTSLSRVKACYWQANKMASFHLPYIFGGSHGTTAFRDESVWIRGVDCSSSLSIILSAGGILGIPRPTFALDTLLFENWGFAGPGKWMTLWVLDSGNTHHCAMEFHSDATFTNRWWQATHEGGPVGWVGFDPTGFHARHWPGT